MKTTSHIIDENSAIEELKNISRNARLFLMDRIGNNLHVIGINNDMGRPEVVAVAVDRFMCEMQRLGMFELYVSKQKGTEVMNTNAAR
jgi:hypothetical protein